MSIKSEIRLIEQTLLPVKNGNFNNDGISDWTGTTSEAVYGSFFTHSKISNSVRSKNNFSKASKGETTPKPSTLSIGDDDFGGKIAYIYQPGDPGYVVGRQKGIVAQVNDIGSYPWGCRGTIIGATGGTLGTGYENTLAIITGCTESDIAALVCYNSTEGGYTDWFLPSIDELSKLYENRILIGNFTTGVYKSSTERPISEDPTGERSRSLSFDNGITYNSLKSINGPVRAIRYFDINDYSADDRTLFQSIPYDYDVMASDPFPTCKAIRIDYKVFNITNTGDTQYTFYLGGLSGTTRTENGDYYDIFYIGTTTTTTTLPPTTTTTTTLPPTTTTTTTGPPTTTTTTTTGPPTTTTTTTLEPALENRIFLSGKFSSYVGNYNSGRRLMSFFIESVENQTFNPLSVYPTYDPLNNYPTDDTIFNLNNMDIDTNQSYSTGLATPLTKVVVGGLAEGDLWDGGNIGGHLGYAFLDTGGTIEYYSTGYTFEKSVKLAELSSVIQGTGFNGSVYDVDKQDDGKFVVVGNFTEYNGNSMACLVRLNTDGSFDDTFNSEGSYTPYPNGFYNNGSIHIEGVKVDNDRIYTWGDPARYNGVMGTLFRFYLDGTIDNKLAPGYSINTFALSQSGKFYCTYYSEMSGNSGTRILRFNNDFTLDNSFYSPSGFEFVSFDQSQNLTQMKIERVPIELGNWVQGGTITYIYQESDPEYIEGEINGIITSRGDLNTRVWGCRGTIIGATGETLGSGVENMNIALSSCTGSTIFSYVDSLGYEGYTDWFLPSKGDFEKMLENQQYIISPVIGGPDVVGFTSGIYWTSTEIDETWAWAVSPTASSNIFRQAAKDDLKYHRSIRYFKYKLFEPEYTYPTTTTTTTTL